MIAKFKKTLRKRSVAAVLVLAVLACINLTDAYSAPPFIFGTPTNLGPTVNSSSSDGGPSISADGLSLFFNSNRPDGHGYLDIYVATRATTEEDWGTPVNLGPTVNSSSSDGGPCLSADGLSLFFHSSRIGGYGGSDIWVTTRVTVGGAWSTPMNLGPPVNSSTDELFPNLSADGLQLYFSEWESPYRPGGQGGSDMWVTTRETVGGAWSTPENLGPTVNSSTHEDAPFITADGLSLFFGSFNRSDGFGGMDLYVTTRKTAEDDWVTPENLGPEVNNSSDSQIPCISADGSTLFFTCNRPDGVGGFDLWQVQIRPRRTIADFNWDRKVDFKDFSKLAQYLGQDESSVDIAPPLGDGIIDFKDVGVFSESWLLSMMQASNPNPADDATGIVTDANLSWKPGDEAALHKVYFGSEPSALPLVATQPVGQDSYDPPGDLILSTTYYWRIDEVNDAGPPPGNWPGVLWSFTAVRGQAHTPSPADGAVIAGEEIEYPPDSGNWYIWTMLIFNPGPTADPDPNLRRTYFSKNRDDVVNRVQDANLGPPPYVSTPGYETKYYAGNPIVAPANDTLVRGTTYYWCADETDADGYTYPGDIWEFTIQGFYAFAPSPPNDAMLVDPNVLLSWGEGYGSQEHDVYLGTSWEDVNNADATDITGIYRGFRMDPNYPCSNLELTTKFYWRIDEVQGRLPPLFPGTIYKGDVWNFTTGSSPPP